MRRMSGSPPTYDDDAKQNKLLEIVGVNALVYLGFSNDNDDRGEDSHTRGPYVVAFGVGPAWNMR